MISALWQLMWLTVALDWLLFGGFFVAGYVTCWMVERRKWVKKLSEQPSEWKYIPRAK